MMLFAAGEPPAALALDGGTITLLGWALIGYVAFLLGVSLYASRRIQDESDYVVAGRKLPLFLAWGTLIATWFGAATMFAAAGAARDEGLLGVVLDPLACAGTLILAGVFFARPLWKMGLYTMADFYRARYGPSAEIVGASIQVPSYFSWVALQYTALASILELYFEIPFVAGVVVVAAVTLVYTLIGGMWSVTLTDTVQIVIALVGLVALLASALSDPLLGDGNPVRGLTTVFAKVSETHPDHLRIVPSDLSLGVIGWEPGRLGFSETSRDRISSSGCLRRGALTQRCGPASLPACSTSCSA
jgi:SSS family solute:Na+ symporter